MSTYYVYVTSLIDAQWERRTGIPRVEYEIARDAVARGGKLITFDKLTRAFVEIDPVTVQNLIHSQDHHLDAALADDAGAPGPMSRMAARLLPLFQRTATRPVLAHVLATAAPALTPATRRHIAHAAGLFEHAPASIRYIKSTTARKNRAWLRLRRTRAAFAAGDRIVVPGIVWRQRPLRTLAALQRRGVLIVPFIHDLIPIRRPEFFTDATGTARFRGFVDAILDCSAAALANSSFVAADVASYALERGLRDIPVRPIPLCANLTPATASLETPRLRALRLQPDNYVLFVSTFSPRKNQRGAYELWKRLHALLGDALPPLVFAGQRGWRSEDLFEDMAADAALWGSRLHFVEAPTDGELAHLYRNCAFTIFPSFYEGWGLPVSESLAFGKPCIAADNTSLPEAGQGLALQLPADDIAAWVDAVLGLIRDPRARQTMAARIADRYRPRTWDEVGADVHAAVAELTPPLSAASPAVDLLSPPALARDDGLAG